MGQYYVPVLGAEDSTRTEFVCEFYAYSHDHNEGLKLMEHSWPNARLPRTVMVALLDNAVRVVWAGDYADPEPDTMSDEGGLNLYVLASGDDESIPAVTKLPPTSEDAPRFIVNHDKRVFVDMEHVPDDGDAPHPLPLLTAEGNGRGGGDWHGGRGDEYVGTWARDLISTATVKPHGFVEFRPDFIEG